MNHVPDELLAAFADGDLDEAVAVHVAEHIDACPACLARASALDPLAPVLATIADPAPPADLVARILAAADAPEAPPAVAAPPLVAARRAEVARERFPWVEIGLGGGMLTAATALALLADGDAWELATDPGFAASRLGVLLGLVHSAGHALRVALGTGDGALTVATAIAVAGLVVTARIALQVGPLDARPREGVA